MAAVFCDWWSIPGMFSIDDARAWDNGCINDCDTDMCDSDMLPPVRSVSPGIPATAARLVAIDRADDTQTDIGRLFGSGLSNFLPLIHYHSCIFHSFVWHCIVTSTCAYI